MEYIRPYQRLIAWKESHLLCMQSYKITANFPDCERYRLVNQICRSAYSIPMNLAEGSVKKSPKERAHYFEISAGSLEELHYQFFFANQLGYISKEIFEEIDKQIHRTSYLIGRLRFSLSKTSIT